MPDSMYRQASQQAFYQSLFQSMLHEVHIWRLVYDANGEIVTWRLLDANPAALAAWGKQLDDIIGKGTDEIFGTNATAQFMPLVQKIMRERKPSIWEQEFPATGQILQMVSIPGDGYFISTGLDITATRTTERELWETLLQLRETITAGNIGLWNWDLETNHVSYSAEWKSQLGYAPDELRDDFEQWRSLVHPEDVEQAMTVVNATVAESRNSYEQEFRMRHKDGSYRWILAHASVMKNEQGRVVRMLGAHTDITKRKEMELRVLQSQKMEAMGTLAGGIAHDFNNLLAPILGYAQVAKLAVSAEHQVFGYLEHIEGAANRAKVLVQKILAISRSSPAEVEAVALDKLVDEVITVLQASASRDISIRFDNRAQHPVIAADPSDIYQVLLNLGTNALQAMPQGGCLDIGLHEAGSRVQLPDGRDLEVPRGELMLRFSDTGIGMDGNTRQRIFEPFFTTREKGEQRGTGLGLAIVANIVKQYRGHIEVFSEPGKGSTFHVSMPVFRGAADRTGATPAIAAGSARHRILLVDDEEALCQLGSTILQRLGYQVEAFTDCDAALAHFRAQGAAFQLVMTDYSMPKSSGPEFIRQIRELAPDLPVLMVTGYSNVASDQNLKEWGCQDIIAKPYDIARLSQTVKQLLERA